MSEGHEAIIQLVAPYATQRHLYEKLVEEVKHLLEDKLINVSIVGRTKDPESLTEKCIRKGYTSLHQATDLAGVRVVHRFASESDAVDGIIRAAFTVHEYVNKSESLGVDKMGYRGVSYIVTLDQRYAGRKYENINTLKCEIQVRTILQDAWALIEHGLIYKNREAIPKRLLRDINNVGSLLEIAQGVFDTVQERREAYQREIEEKRARSSPLAFLAQPVDLETVEVYTKWKYPELPVSAYVQALLMRDLNADRYPTLAVLDAAIERARAAVGQYQRENPAWFKTGTDYITKSLGFVDEEFRGKHPFSNRTRTAFDKYKDLIKNL